MEDVEDYCECGLNFEEVGIWFDSEKIPIDYLKIFRGIKIRNKSVKPG